MKKIKNYLKKVLFDFQKKRNLHTSFVFENRSQGKEKLCLILIGYKPLLWKAVLGRLKKFVPNDVDVCLTSSGKYCEELSKLCLKNNWSYLSTKKNNLCLAMNVTIKQFKEALYIYKLDEDMFISKGFFETLFETSSYVNDNTIYNVGIVAPLIPINGFGYYYLLKKYDQLEQFEKQFGKSKITCGEEKESTFTRDCRIPPYFWNRSNPLSDIDSMNLSAQHSSFSFLICPIRFSIGAILFSRKLWEDMGMFTVHGGNGLASDEIQICEYCNSHSQSIVVSENSIVGHFAYGPQTGNMFSYFDENQDIFFTKE